MNLHVRLLLNRLRSTNEHPPQKILLAGHRPVDHLSLGAIFRRKRTTTGKNCHAGANTVSSVHGRAKNAFARKLEMLFQLQNVTKTYGAITALNDLSVAVPTGAIG